MVKLSDRKCSVSRYAAPSIPIKRGSNDQAYEMRKKRQNKREERKRLKKEKMGDLIETKNNLYAHTFSQRDPCATTFRESKILYLLLFSSKLLLKSCLFGFQQ